MNPQRLFVRKIGYLVAIGVLVVVGTFLGQPATRDAEGKSSPGGYLARLRTEHKLSDVQFGEIDPAGNTMKLVTLGLRGVAANILWNQADDYKKKKDWSNLSATLEQIVKLEPHFIMVWRFQGWNLSYNVSAEFDDYRERYRWVMRGIEFLREGIRYNENEPALVTDVAWFISNKIGRADEAKQFRRLFKQDDDFHKDRPEEQRDNWLVGREWFKQAERKADDGADIKRVAPVLFYSHGPMCKMNYSEAIEKDGIFGEKARVAWADGESEWYQLGARELANTDIEGKVEKYRLNDQEAFEREIEKLVASLDALEPGLRAKIREERRSQLSEAEKKVAATPPEQRKTRELAELGLKADETLKVTNDQLARRLTGSKQKQALQLSRQIAELEAKVKLIDGNRKVISFPEWRRHAKVEQTREAIEARRLVFEGDAALAKADLLLARDSYKKAFEQWRLVLDRKEWPDLKESLSMGQDLIEMIDRYRKILERSATSPEEEKLPANFPLQDIIKRWDSEVSHSK
jgi:hypothetical protein